MISHKHKCIFIHIPKACGNAVEYVLDGFSLKSGEPWNNDIHRRNDSTKEFYFDRRQRHWTWRHYQRSYPGEFQAYFKFAVVRNPFDSLVSHLAWGQQGNSPVYESHWGLKEIIWRNPLLFRHLSPSRYVFSRSGRLMVDLIIRHERLDREWVIVAEKLGLPEILPVLNQSERGPYQDFYTPALRKIAAWGFLRDKQRLGYRYIPREKTV